MCICIGELGPYTLSRIANSHFPQLPSTVSHAAFHVAVTPIHACLDVFRDSHWSDAPRLGRSKVVIDHIDSYIRSGMGVALYS